MVTNTYDSTSACSADYRFKLVKESELDEELTISPSKLLTIAILKRRSVCEAKERDFRREVLNTGMIQSLCKWLGTHRRCRKGGNRLRRRSSSWKRRWDERSDVEFDMSSDQLVPNSDEAVELTGSQYCPEISKPQPLQNNKFEQISGGISTDEPLLKRFKMDDIQQSSDPLGLDDLFSTLYSTSMDNCYTKTAGIYYFL